METDDFAKVSELLQNAILINADFEYIINQAKADDLLFIDPPYTVNHYNNGFIKYNEELFSWDDQKRLSECLKQAKKRGANIVITNASHSSIKKLYEDSFSLQTVKRSSIIAANPSNRKQSKELIIKG